MHSLGYYKPGPDKMTFEDAEQYCKKTRNLLYLPLRQDMNDEFATKARQFVIIKHDESWNQVWIYARRSRDTNEFYNNKGVKLFYSNFIPGRDKQGDCIALNVTRENTFTQNWVTVDCDLKLNFFCHT